MTVTASRYARKPQDSYETEPWVTEALLKHLQVKNLRVWEPAAGNHLMADVIKRHGAKVTTSDIATYDRRHTFEVDFLSDELGVSPGHVDAMITNPPYGPQGRTAVKFIEKALDLCPGQVAMLLTAKFDSGRTRAHLFRDNPRFCLKIVLLDRISWTLNGSTGTEDHAIYIWRGKRHGRHPQIIYEEKPR